MGAATLPGCPWQGGADRLDQPAVGVAVIRATPDSPRAVRPRKKASQPAPSSPLVTSRPRISRCPSVVGCISRHDRPRWLRATADAEALPRFAVAQTTSRPCRGMSDNGEAKSDAVWGADRRRERTADRIVKISSGSPDRMCRTRVVVLDGNADGNAAPSRHPSAIRSARFHAQNGRQRTPKTAPCRPCNRAVPGSNPGVGSGVTCGDDYPSPQREPSVALTPS